MKLIKLGFIQNMMYIKEDQQELFDNKTWLGANVIEVLSQKLHKAIIKKLKIKKEIVLKV